MTKMSTTKKEILVNIHRGLPNAEIRNVICYGLIDSQITERLQLKKLADQKSTVLSKLQQYDRMGNRLIIIQERELQKQEIDVRISAERTEYAFLNLMDYMGWTEFDVSDELGGLNYRDQYVYPNFIGTKEEYEKLLTAVKDNDE